MNIDKKFLEKRIAKKKKKKEKSIKLTQTILHEKKKEDHPYLHHYKAP